MIGLYDEVGQLLNSKLNAEFPSLKSKVRKHVLEVKGELLCQKFAYLRIHENLYVLAYFPLFLPKL